MDLDAGRGQGPTRERRDFSASSIFRNFVHTAQLIRTREARVGIASYRDKTSDDLANKVTQSPTTFDRPFSARQKEVGPLWVIFWTTFFAAWVTAISSGLGISRQEQATQGKRLSLRNLYQFRMKKNT